MYDFLYDWAAGNEPEKAKVWFADREKMLAILRHYMGIGMKRRRKDFIYAKQIFELIGYFFEENNDAEEFKFDKDTVKEILKEYLAGYDHNDDNSA